MGLVRDAFDDGVIFLGDAFPVALQGVLGGFRAGENEQAGGFAIQPMDDENTGIAARRALPHIGIELRVGRAGFLALGGDGEEAGGFVHHEDRFVFVNDFHSARKDRARGGMLSEGNADDRAFRQGVSWRGAGVPAMAIALKRRRFFASLRSKPRAEQGGSRAAWWDARLGGIFLSAHVTGYWRARASEVKSPFVSFPAMVAAVTRSPFSFVPDMADIKFFCPECQQRIAVDETAAGLPIREAGLWPSGGREAGSRCAHEWRPRPFGIVVP